MTYQQRLLSHLADYKRSALGITESGLFQHRGQVLSYDHILPAAVADLNLLPLARRMEPGFRARCPQVQRHRYFHHLNSSQAFAFNLFLPFFESSGSAQTALLRAFGQSGSLQSWQLECVPDEAEGSNLDVVWRTQDRLTTICEVKLSESEFGTAANDARHRAKLDSMYRPVLSPWVESRLLEPDAFCEAYQVLRNLWHLLRADQNRLVFLLPRANDRLREKLSQLLTGIRGPIRGRVYVMAIEDVLIKLGDDTECAEPLREHIRELRRKYVLVE